MSTWFRDYVYIPLGGSRKGKYRTYANLFIVFVVSGLWHGAAWTFVIWGAIHGLGLMVEKAVYNIKRPWFTKIGFHKQTFSNQLFFGGITFVLVCLAWVFFRANSLGDAIMVAGGIFKDFQVSHIFTDSIYLIGFQPNEFKVVCFSILALLVAEVIHQRYNLLKLLNRNGIVLRWAFYFVIVFTIIIFGVYGDEHAQEFIYFQF